MPFSLFPCPLCVDYFLCKHSVHSKLTTDKRPMLVLTKTLISSPEPMVQVSFSDHQLSVARPSVRLSVFLSVCTLVTFFTSSLKPSGHFNQLWYKASLLEGNVIGIKYCIFFRNGDNCETVRIACMSLKIFLSRTTAPEMPLFI